MKTYLTPGPSQLYFTYDYHIRNAIRENIGSISHRSSEFKKIYQHTLEMLKSLLGIPEDFNIVFTSSATEIWERIIQNQVTDHSFHLTNGAFSEKFAGISEDLNRRVTRFSGAENNGFVLDNLSIPEDAELISITQNETSMGSQFPLEDIATIRQKYPEKIIAVDAVSSIPYPEFNYDQFDHLYFSVQKCFGLPSGLGVWIVNNKSLERAKELRSNGHSIGSYHSLPKLVEMSNKFQTPETPNTLNIYLLGKVAEDMLNKGLDMIRRETNYKYALINQTIQDHPDLEQYINTDKYRSRTVVVVKSDKSEQIIHSVAEKGFILGTGYGKNKGKHIRIANFPTISKERMEMFVDIFPSLSL